MRTSFSVHAARRGRVIRILVTLAVVVVAFATAGPVARTRGGEPGAGPGGPGSGGGERGRGLQFVAAVGMDGCTGQQCWNTYPLLYTRVHALFRVFKYLAAGAHLAFNFLAPDFPTGGARVEFWELLVGPEVRGVVPIRRFDLWVGFAFGYYRSYRLVDSDGHEIESATNAFGLGWGLGLDYYLLEGKAGRLAVGGDLWFYKPFPTRLCSTVGGNPTSCLDRGIADQFGVTYAAGATLTWFFPL
jgi:hypothetical protein